jgi:hypothetical protein
VQDNGSYGADIVKVRARMLEIQGYLELIRHTAYQNTPRESFQLLMRAHDDGKDLNATVRSAWFT